MWHKRHGLSVLDRLAIGLSMAAITDRIVKTGLVARYFSRRPPADPAVWPSVTILQTVTRGVDALRSNLEARARLEYPGHIQHILVCDANDAALQSICREMAAAHPELDLRVISVKGEGAGPATKLTKLRAGFPLATGDVLCLMDDDVAPRQGSLRRLVAHLMEPGVGASFGLACYTSWQNLWSGLLSAYVNLYDIEFFVAWATLCGPVRVVGQMACYWRRPFVTIAGFEDLEDYIDDDFVLGQRLREAGLRPVQAPVIYDVNDPVESWQGYEEKFKRWIILPRHGMEPFLTRWQRFAAFLATPATILLPSVLGALALLTRRRITLAALIATLGTFAASQAISYSRILRSTMPPRRWPSVLYAVLVTPVHAALTVLAGHEIEWRGQRMRVYRDGHFERVA